MGWAHEVSLENLTGFTCGPHLLVIGPTYLPSEVFLQDSRNLQVLW